MARVLIADYPGGQVIAGARALARDGDHCALAWPRGRLDRLAMSRSLRAWHPVPSAIDDPAGFVEGVRGLVAGGGFDVLLPFGLDACHAVARHADRLAPHVGFAAPPYGRFALANDKLATARHCAAIGVPVPRVFSGVGEADLDAVCRAARFPVVVKARSGSGVSEALRYAEGPEALRRIHGAMVERSGRAGVRDFSAPLIQEFVPGHIHDACTVSWRGEVVAALTQVRQVMSPIYGGVGAINRTTDAPALRRRAIEVLESLDWHGPAQVEFKYDPRDRTYKLIEINPKLWGTLPLSIAAGLSFPALIRDLVLGRPVRRFPPYRVGLRFGFLFPQSTQAVVQLGRRFGWGRVWRARGQLWPDVVDVDPADPLPDLRRAAGAVWRQWRRGTDEANAGLGLARVNPPESIR